MRLETRKLLDKAFSGLGLIAIAIMGMALLLILTPIMVRGSKAFVFKGTIEHRRVMLEQFDRGSPEVFNQEMARIAAARAPVYQMLADFKAEMKEMDRTERGDYKAAFKDVEKGIKTLLGPAPGERKPVLLRQQYGQTRWDRVQIKLHEVLYAEAWDYSNPDAMGVLIETPRGETAPIIFTAAVSVGAPLKIWETLSQPTPALPWNIYNLCTEHEAVDEIRHVQYGMVFTLVVIVLLLNLGAILMRARISKKLRG